MCLLWYYVTVPKFLPSNLYLISFYSRCLTCIYEGMVASSLFFFVLIYIYCCFNIVSHMYVCVTCLYFFRVARCTICMYHHFVVWFYHVCDICASSWINLISVYSLLYHMFLCVLSVIPHVFMYTVRCTTCVYMCHRLHDMYLCILSDVPHVLMCTIGYTTYIYVYSQMYHMCLCVPPVASHVFVPPVIPDVSPLRFRGE